MFKNYVFCYIILLKLYKIFKIIFLNFFCWPLSFSPLTKICKIVTFWEENDKGYYGNSEKFICDSWNYRWILAFTHVIWRQIMHNLKLLNLRCLNISLKPSLWDINYSFLHCVQSQYSIVSLQNYEIVEFCLLILWKIAFYLCFDCCDNLFCRVQAGTIWTDS